MLNRKHLAFLFGASILCASSSYALLPENGAASSILSNRGFFGFASNDTYRIGDEWGKFEVTEQSLSSEPATFRRAALATGHIGGGTGFYLGKFNGMHLFATNHHVCPTSCEGESVNFPMLHAQVRVTQFYGSWSDVDLSLMALAITGARQEAQFKDVGANFAFHSDLYPGQELLTIGFGIAGNPHHALMANRDSDCKVFSAKNDFHFMGDPDDLNPADYKAWSFANGCDVSHGDSGSAMVDRQTGEVVGIIWTGRIPKEARVQSSAYLTELLRSQGEDIWTQLSYAVPAQKIGEFLEAKVKDPEMSESDRKTLSALIH